MIFAKKSGRGFGFCLGLFLLLALLIGQAGPAMAQDGRPLADLVQIDEVDPEQPLPIDGIWRLRELNKQVAIENGHVFALEGWMHLFVWVVEPGMVTSTKLRQTDRQKLTAYDALLKRQMEWTVREDGTIFASGGEGLLAPKFSLEPVELSYPEAFEAVRLGHELLLTPDGFALADRPDPLDVDLEITGPVTSADGMCLDLNGSDVGKQGGRIQVWKCLGSENQRFIFLPDNGLLVAASGMCLEAVGPDNGAPVRAFGCDGKETQIWETRETSEGGIAFVHKATGHCLDAHGPESKRNGGRIQIWDCFYGNNQRWSM
ncbi:MAG: RICIN domain-containing protein [Parasphingorhabdus sp.]|uniref:RICIN domain-containing protein n=1 Tax=Parasphingorhabdus sp. TaxID=2709688 RepID=UPI003264693B